LARQLIFAAITTAFTCFWLYIFWPTIVMAVIGRDVSHLGVPAALIGLGCAVAVLMPMSPDPRRRRR
jgi:hypothetical protein